MRFRRRRPRRSSSRRGGAGRRASSAIRNMLVGIFSLRILLHQLLCYSQASVNVLLHRFLRGCVLHRLIDVFVRRPCCMSTWVTRLMHTPWHWKGWQSFGSRLTCASAETPIKPTNLQRNFIWPADIDGILHFEHGRSSFGDAWCM
jgi:hypothetical protein